jgi:hypothetical protein
MLVGPTASGKTTLLLHLLRSGRAEYLANDRVRVSFQGGIQARGIPSIVALRPRTRELFPELTQRLAARGYQYRRALAEHPVLPAPLEPWPDERLGLSPAHLADAAGVARAAEGEVAAVAFPTITGEPGGLALRPLSPAEGARRLRENLLGAGHWCKRSSVFVLPGAPSVPTDAALAGRCTRLANAVPCVEARVGLDAYQDAASATPLLVLTH